MDIYNSVVKRIALSSLSGINGIFLIEIKIFKNYSFIF